MSSLDAQTNSLDARMKGRGQPCKQGEAAARSGCIPAQDSGGRRLPGREGAGQFSGASPGTVYSVKYGSMESRFSLHTDKRIAGPAIPLKNYKQQDYHSCGFVAALTVARYFLPGTAAKEVLKTVRPTKSGGIDGKSLVGALKQLGVDAKFTKALTVPLLRRLVAKGVPVLLTVYPEDWTSDHWTVVQGFDDERVYLTNYKSLPIAQFEKEWFDRGEGLVCTPREEKSLDKAGRRSPVKPSAPAAPEGTPGTSWAGKPCKPGVSAARTGCIPAADDAGDGSEAAGHSEEPKKPVKREFGKLLSSDVVDKPPAEVEAALTKYAPVAFAQSTKMGGMSEPEDMVHVNSGGVEFYFSEKTRKAAAESLATYTALKIPKKLAQATKKIVITEQGSKFDSHWEKEFGIKGFKATATALAGETTSYHGKALNGSVFCHESGHNLAHELWGSPSPPEDSPYGMAQKGEGPVSKYGANDPAEDFAEACAWYAGYEPENAKGAGWLERLGGKVLPELTKLIVGQAKAGYSPENKERFRKRFPKKFAAIKEIMGD